MCVPVSPCRNFWYSRDSCASTKHNFIFFKINPNLSVNFLRFWLLFPQFLNKKFNIGAPERKILAPKREKFNFLFSDDLL